LGALGDVIRTTPLVVKYKEMYPNCHITWLTHSPDVLPTQEIDLILKPDAFSILQIQATQFDIAINLDKEMEACYLLEKTHASEKYGYIAKNGQLAPATPAAEHKIMTGLFDQLSQQNTLSYLEEIFAICHLEFKLEPYLIRKNVEYSEHWKLKLGELAKGKKIVGLNTGCGPRWNTRLWPVHSWVELAKSLTQAGFFPVFLGGSLEHDKNTMLSKEAAVYYPGHFSLEEFIALTAACDIVVTQVSMMMHIATALQKELILMNNIFNPHEFELYGRGEIVQPDEKCICYYGNSCVKGPDSCMHDLPASKLMKTILTRYT
jgi:heptosyltransferase-2